MPRKIKVVIDQHIYIDPSELGDSQKYWERRFPLSQFKTRDVFASNLSKPQATRHFFLCLLESTAYLKKFLRQPSASYPGPSSHHLPPDERGR
jgi:hypothetical protein